jgi:mitochondrial fusion and transport protein UGO1
MSNPREGPNPLRPYYIPPSIGLLSETKPSSSFESSGKNAAYVPSARNIFSDIDYSNYVSESSQSTLDNIRSLLDDALHKYMSVLLAQPFDVAKTILQVKSQASPDGTIAMADSSMRERHVRPRDSMYADVGSQLILCRLAC